MVIFDDRISEVENVLRKTEAKELRVMGAAAADVGYELQG